MMNCTGYEQIIA